MSPWAEEEEEVEDDDNDAPSELLEPLLEVEPGSFCPPRHTITFEPQLLLVTSQQHI